VTYLRLFPLIPLHLIEAATQKESGVDLSDSDAKVSINSTSFNRSGATLARHTNERAVVEFPLIPLHLIEAAARRRARRAGRPEFPLIPLHLIEAAILKTFGGRSSGQFPLIPLHLIEAAGKDKYSNDFSKVSINSTSFNRSGYLVLALTLLVISLCFH
jgi:hypothetical protein